MNEPSSNHINLVKNNIDTLQKVFQFTVNKYKDYPCLGTRKIISEEDELQPNGRTFKKVLYILFYI